MRTTKRFTPRLLNKWHKVGRGLGTYENYSPWHQVTRSDPASRGTSFIINYRKRQVHLLSRHEYDVFIFCIQIPNLIDLREQYPLQVQNSEHEINAYFEDRVYDSYLGTNKIAEELGYKHWQLDKSTEWVMTTDFLLTLKNPITKKKFLLAVSVKCKDKLTDGEKMRQHIEKEYWNKRGVEWLLITPETYSREAIEWGRLAYPKFNDEISLSKLTKIKNEYLALKDRSHFEIIVELQSRSEYECLNTMLWTSIWKGVLTLDIHKPLISHRPPTVISRSEFYSANPIVSRRTAWK